jgi:hypothetical protein
MAKVPDGQLIEAVLYHLDSDPIINPDFSCPVGVFLKEITEERRDLTRLMYPGSINRPARFSLGYIPYPHRFSSSGECDCTSGRDTLSNSEDPYTQSLQGGEVDSI